MIAAKIKDAGVRKSRTPKDVQNKIEYVEKCFRCAHDWSHTETGAGLRENDSGTYEEALLRKCPWYFDIREIFEDRANARPFHTTDDMFQEASSDDDSECHRRSNIVDLHNDEDTEDEEDIKVGPVARSLFGANDGKDGKGKKLRYSPLEPSLFAPVAGNVEDVSNDNDDIRYDYDDDVEVVEDVGVEEDGGIKEDGVVREDRFVKVDGDIGQDSALEKENKGAKVLNKKAGKKELHTKSKTTIPLSVNKKKENVAPSTTKKKRKTDPDDAFSMEVIKCFNLTNNKKEETERFRSRELHRHNKAMEDLAAREQTLKERQSDFDFKMKRLEHYRELKGKFEPEFIRAVFPKMGAFINADAIIDGRVVAKENIAGGSNNIAGGSNNNVANANIDSDSDGN
jgi:hypothetical protein